METVTYFIFMGSKITAGGECSHEIKGHLLLGRKVMTNLDGIFKSRHYFANKGPSSQGYDFFQWSCMDVRVGLYRKLSTKELMLLNCGVGEDSSESKRRLLRVPWTESRSNQSTLKKISPEYSLEGLMLKLKLQYFGYLM